MPIKPVLELVALSGLLLLFSNAANPAQPPGIEGVPPRSVIAGREYFFQPELDSLPGRTLTYQIHNRPSWATFWSANGRLFGTPTPGDIGTYHDVTIEVHDGNKVLASTAFWIRVDPYSEDYDAPQIWGVPKPKANVDAGYRYTPKTYDPDGHSLTFAIVNQPAWSSFSTYDGTLNGRPGPGDLGTYRNIRIKATDGKKVALLPMFSIEVTDPANANRVPTINAKIPPRVIVGNEWAVRFQAEDPEGDPVTLAISNKPDWMEFWAQSGWLVGTPEWADIGMYPRIRITASDGHQEVQLPTFSIHVDPKGTHNSKPSIIGTPAQLVGRDQWYDYQPYATDPDGHVVTFSIRNKPDWADFDSNTGRLYGRPRFGDIGEYDSIVVTATDGVKEDQTKPFSIRVRNLPTRSVVLRWQPPTANVDGTYLNDLAGYNIYFGRSKGNYPDRIVIDNPGVSSYVVDGLPPGTYYFVATSYNRFGIESEFSNVAVKVVAK